MSVCWFGLRRFWWVWLVVVLLSDGATPLASEVEEVVPTPTFRRVFVPAQAPATWPVEGQRYLPITQERFSQLLSESDQASQIALPVPVAITQATYRSQWSSDRVLRGTAAWQIELTGERIRLMSLADFELPVISAAWQSPAERPAVLGLWQLEQQQSQPAVLVESSGELLLRWELSPIQNNAVFTEYLLNMPVAVPQFFSVEVPASAQVDIADARLLKKDSESAETQTWTFQLPAQSQHRLRLDWPVEAMPSQSQPVVSETIAYEIEPEGLTLSTQIRVDARDTVANQLVASLPAGVQIAKVTVDQQAADWQLATTGNQQRLVVSLPPSTQPQLLEILAWAEYRAEVKWQLPTLRFHDVQWTEGTMSLFVSPQLELRNLVPREASLQHIVGIHSATQSGEVHRLEQWSDEASLELVVGRREPQLQEFRLASFEIDRLETKARVDALVACKRGKVFQLEASVARGWAIDSVSTNSDAILREWTVDQIEAANHVRIQLNRPLVAGSALTLSFEVHKLSEDPILPASMKQLDLIRFVNVDRLQNVLRLWSREAQEVRVPRRLEDLQIAVEQLPMELQSLIPSTQRGGLFDATHLPPMERIAFRRRSAQYEADFRIGIEALPDSWKHEYDIKCQVQSGSITELLLAVDEPLPGDLQWQLPGQQGTVVQQAIEASQDTPGSNETHQYRLRLPSPQTGDFQLQVQYSQPAKQVEVCNLVRLANSADWSGRVELRGDLNRFVVHDSGRTPRQQSVDHDSPVLSPLLGVYSWNPEEDQRARATGRLRVSRITDAEAAPTTVAWLASYETMQSADGSALHTASYYLENYGLSEASVSLPARAELHEAWINQDQYQPKEVFASPGVYRIRFPSDQRYPLLVLKYSTRSEPLQDTQTLKPTLPRCSFPVSRSQWTLLAPEQYEIDNSRYDYSSVRYHWWKRLFGPLARSRGETVFDPLESADWQEIWSTPLESQQAKQSAQQLVDRLRSRFKDNPSKPVGMLLEELADDLLVGSLLRVDRIALLANRVQATTPPQNLAKGISSSRSAYDRPQPLSHYHLALVVSPGSILLTTTERASLWYDQLRNTETEGLLLVATEDLTNQIEAEKKLSLPQLVTVSEWRAASQASDPIWEMPSPSLMKLGSRSKTIEFVQESPTLTVRRAYFERALWYEVALLAVVAGVWKLAHFPNLMLLLGAIAGAACLVVPAHWLTIFQAFFLGLIVAAIVRVVIKTAELADEAADGNKQPLRRTMAVLLIGGVSLGQALPVSAQAIEAGGAEIPAILIPIDEKGALQGEDVYLPEDFLKRLQLSNRTNQRDGAKVAILSASYRGSLPSDLDQTQPTSDSQELKPWTLRWKVESFEPGAKLYLPLKRDEANWSEGDHHLDGESIALEWETDGEGCRVLLPDVGVHWLELFVRPQMTRKDDHALLQLHVARVPSSRLELSTSMQQDEFEVLGAGRFELDKTRNLWSGSLAALDTIEVRWRFKESQAETAAASRVQQLTWLKIDSSASRVDVQVQLSELQLPSRVLELDIPQQLKLAALPPNTIIEKVLPPSPGQPNRLRLLLRAELPGQVVLRLPFELQRQSSIGRFFFPRVVVRDIPLTTHLFAVSVATGLSFEEQPAPGVRTLQPDEFADTWANGEEVPLFAYAVSQRVPDWSLRVWPDPRSFSAQEALLVHCFANELEVEYEAMLADVRGDWLMHLLQVPAGLTVDTVTVEDQTEGLSIPVHWSRSEDLRQVTIFAGQPLQRRHLLRLTGHVPVTLGEDEELPIVHLKQTGASHLPVEIFQEENIKVTWTRGELPADSLEPESGIHPHDEYLLGRFRLSLNELQRLPRIRLEKNRQLFVVDSVTTLKQNASGWTATLNSQLQVQDGELHRLRVNAPIRFGPPYVLEPRSLGLIEGEREVAGRKEVEIRLTSALAQSEAISLQLTGQLKLSPEQKVSVPDLRYVGTARQDRFVMLPRLIDSRPVVWQTNGLRRESVPSHVSPLIPSGLPSFAFRVLRPEFYAVESSYRGGLRNAKLRQVVIEGFLDEDLQLSATAEILLQPGRSTNCELELPEQAELLQLVVGDASVRREPTAGGTWKVVLGPPWMPQRLLVSYRCPVQRKGRRLQFEPPQILLGDQAMPMPKTWWKLQVPQHWQLQNPLSARQSDSSELQQADCLAVLKTLGEGFPESLELSKEEAEAWATFWDQRLEIAQRNWTTTAAEAEQVEAMAEAEGIRRTMVEYHGESETDEAGNPDDLRYPLQLPRLLIDSFRKEEFIFLVETGGRFETDFASISGGSSWRRLAAMGLVLGAGLLISRLRRVPLWHQQLCQWPHGLAFAGGVLWWLLLRPSALGMLVMLVTSISFALQHWRSYRGRITPEPETQLALPAN